MEKFLLKFDVNKIRYNHKFVPIATIFLLIITAIITSLQFFYPEIISYFGRNPQIFTSDEYWRLITPIFIHPEGWAQIFFDFYILAILGYFTEKFYGSFRLLILYFTAGFIGEIAGYFWQPYSGGSSVASMGLLGALLIWIIYNRASLPFKIYIWGPIGIIGGVLLCIFQNIHGPPIILGSLIALLMLRH